MFSKLAILVKLRHRSEIIVKLFFNLLKNKKYVKLLDLGLVDRNLFGFANRCYTTKMHACTVYATKDTKTIDKNMLPQPYVYK